MQALAVEVAIKAVLIAAGTAGVLWILNVKTAAARHAAWSGVVVFMLLLAPWSIWGPRLPLRWLPPPPEQTAARAVTTAETFEPAAVAPGAMPSVSVPAPGTAWALGLYLVGASLFLTRLALGTIQGQLLIHRALSRDGRLFSNACSAPVTIGWLRPVVVLPESWSRWPASQLDAVLTHEHEHARRRDPLFQWLALLNRAVFWYHPLAWWLERRITALAEEACDAAVLARGHDPRDYSKCLIEMARSVSNSGARIQVWGMAMPGGFLEERIRRILAGGPLPRLSRARLVFTCIACAATSAAFASSALDRRRPARQPDRKVVVAQTRAAVPEPSVIPDGPGVKVSGAGQVWHFSKEAAPRQQASIQFELPQAAPAPAPPLPGSLGGIIGAAHSTGQDQELAQPRSLQRIVIQRLSQAAAEELRGRLPVREGQMLDNESLQRVRQAAGDFDESLTVLVASTGADAAVLIVLPKPGAAVKPEHAPAAGAPSVSLSDVPRRLHIDIQGLSPEATAELRRRLAVREGEILDHAAFLKELERIHRIVSEFDPRLSDGKMLGKAPRVIGPDGKVLMPDVIDNTLIISPRNSAPQAGGLQPYSRIARPPANPLGNVPLKLHIDIRGLSPETAEELRRRLAAWEGQTADSETLRKTVERIRAVMKEFDPRLTSEMHMNLPPGKFDRDGKPIPPESVQAKLIITLAEAPPYADPDVR